MLRRENNAEMVGGINQRKEDSEGMKTTMEVMVGRKGGNKDTEDIPGRKVKKKDTRNKCDPKESVETICDEVLKWTIGKGHVEYTNLRIMKKIDRVPAHKGSKRSNEHIVTYAQQEQEDYGQQSAREIMIP